MMKSPRIDKITISCTGQYDGDYMKINKRAEISIRVLDILLAFLVGVIVTQLFLS